VIVYNAEPRHPFECPPLPATEAQQRILDAVTAASARDGLALSSELKVLTYRGGKGVSGGGGMAGTDTTGKLVIHLDATRAPSELAHTFAHELRHIGDKLEGRSTDVTNPDEVADSECRANEFADRHSCPN
jgi:hypothetical protein